MAVVLCGTTGPAASPAAFQLGQNAASLFRQYRGGDWVGAMQHVSALSEAQVDSLVRDIRRRAGGWVRDAGGTDRARLDVATFMIDVAWSRLETDWQVVRDLTEIACRLVDPIYGSSGSVRRWHLAALALIEGAADARFLVDTPRAKEVPTFTHLAHSRSKFPDEPRFRLAEAVVEAMGHADLAPPRDQPWYDDDELKARPGSINRVEVSMRNERRVMRRDFEALTKVEGIAAEAHLRVGHLAYQLNDDTAALEHLGAAVAGSEDTFIEYVAHLVSAMVHSRRNERALAEASLRRALEVVPFAQSAVELLSAELFLTGRESQAHDLLESWFLRRNRPVDPWRLFGYGDFRALPGLMSMLRREVGK